MIEAWHAQHEKQKQDTNTSTINARKKWSVSDKPGSLRSSYLTYVHYKYWCSIEDRLFAMGYSLEDLDARHDEQGWKWKTLLQQPRPLTEKSEAFPSLVSW